MTSSTRRLAMAPAVVALLMMAAPLVQPDARAASPALRSPALCGPLDTPETGIQGDLPRAEQATGGRAERGYNCGLAVIGHHDLAGFGGGALAQSDHCAYVVPRSGPGINVFDMSDPTAPEMTAVLPTAVDSENIAAVTTDDRAVLVASGANKTVDVYDVRDCEHPVALGQIHYPPSPAVVQHVHNISLSPDGTKVFGTMPLTRADITHLADASTWTVETFQCDVAAQVHPAHAGPAGVCRIIPPDQVFAILAPGPQIAHYAEFNSKGTRLYVGGQLLSLPEEEYVRIFDLTVWPPRPIGETRGSGHGMNYATIGGRPYLLNSGEGGHPGGGCAPHRPLDAPPPTGLPVGPGDSLEYGHQNAEANLIDISEEAAPKTLSRLRLAINNPEPEPCAAQVDSFLGPACTTASSAATKGCTATPHYTNVDDPKRTTFAMVSMMSAGLRVFDVRDPAKPTEVAYFSPGVVRQGDQQVLDPAGSHPYYNASRGHIWLTTRMGGLWVLELEPQVRDALRLPRKTSLYPDGRPAREGALASLAFPAAATAARTSPYLYLCGV